MSGMGAPAGGGRRLILLHLQLGALLAASWALQSHQQQQQQQQAKAEKAEPAAAVSSLLVRPAGHQAQLECRLRPPPPPGGVAAATDATRNNQRQQVIDETPARAGASVQRRSHEAPEGGDGGGIELASEGAGPPASERLENQEDQDDDVQLILWYHSPSASSQLRPIYIVDARQQQALFQQQQQQAAAANSTLVQVGESERGRHYALAAAKGRLSLAWDATTNGASARLVIERLRAEDAGHYKCRVDFRWARTWTQSARLEVLAPVTRLQIELAAEGDKGGQPSLLAPIDLSPSTSAASEDNDEGAFLVVPPPPPPQLSPKGARGEPASEEADVLGLECRAKDGWPPARLAWWRLVGVPDAGGLGARFVQVAPARVAPAAARLAIAAHNRSAEEPEQPIKTNSDLGANNGGHVGTTTKADEEAQWAQRMAGELSSRLGALWRERRRRRGPNKATTDQLLVGARWPSLLCQRRLVLYACGASNSAGPNSALGASAATTEAASGKPAFRWLLANWQREPPRWARMFLVGRRQASQIELANLRPGQSIHLNLASAAPTGRQLHLLCQVGGGGGIEWRRQDEASPEWRRLVSEGERETNGLIQQLALENNGHHSPRAAAAASSEACELGDSDLDLDLGDLGLNQGQDGPTAAASGWSSLRLHNISFADHELAIKCFAATKENDGDSSDAAAWARLNITHVPQLSVAIATNEEGTGGSNASLIGVGAELGENKELAAVYGANVTLACSVRFANPPLVGPIEWSINDTKALESLATDQQQQQLAVRVIERKTTTATANGRHSISIERLIVQFSGGGGYASVFLKCSARNALGRGESNRLRLVIGRPPYCPPPASDKRRPSPADGDHDDHDKANRARQLHCPVISEPATSTYRWLRRDQPPLATAAHTLQAAESPPEVGRCYAADRFGSNQHEPCAVQPLWADAAAPNPRAQSCAARLEQRPGKPKQSAHKRQAGLLLAVRCPKAVRLAAAHLDLYRRPELAGANGSHDARFVRRLIGTRPPSADAADWGDPQLVAELDEGGGGELARHLEGHFIVMRAIGRSGDDDADQANVTIELASNLLPAELNTGSGGSGGSGSSNEPANPAGHRDRLWVIGGIVVVFLSSSLLVIIAWLCKGATDQQQQRPNNKTITTTAAQGLVSGIKRPSGSESGSESGGQSRRHCAAQEREQQHQQTEMYLVGEDGLPRPAAYHNHYGPPLLITKPEKPTHDGEPTTTTDPYDFLIIADPTPTSPASLLAATKGRQSDQGASILLIESPEPTCTRFHDHHHHRLLHLQPAGGSSHHNNNGSLAPLGHRRHQCHIESRHHHLDSSHVPAAALLRPWPAQPTAGSSSTSTISSTNLNLNQNFHSPTTTGFGFVELNSQGELTMTDESSSFVLHQQQQPQATELVCRECWSSGLLQVGPLDYRHQLNDEGEDEGDDREAEEDKQPPHLHADAALRMADSSSQSSQSLIANNNNNEPAAKVTTLKRNNKRERVRFVD